MGELFNGASNQELPEVRAQVDSEDSRPQEVPTVRMLPALEGGKAGMTKGNVISHNPKRWGEDPEEREARLEREREKREAESATLFPEPDPSLFRKISLKLWLAKKRIIWFFEGKLQKMRRNQEE